MENLIRQQDLQYFLEDVERKGTVELVEGSEKSELLKVAKARNYQLNSRDLGLFKTIYAFTDKANSNGAILPEKALLKVLPQIIGKPVNINHERNKVVGHYIDYRYIKSSKKIIVYGAFYKSYFENEWELAKALFKKRKLSTSFEIWSPKKNRVTKKDGSYILQQMEIAGGALVYEDFFNQPAFKNAKALAVAKESKPKELELVVAKYKDKYDKEEIITANTIEVKQAPTRVKCQNCQEEFDINPTVSEHSCIKCKAIVDKEGKIIYPPQLQSWKGIDCPKCRVDNWRIIKQTDEKADVKCGTCNKDYELIFKSITNLSAFTDKLLFFGSASCPQCKKTMPISQSTAIKSREMTCPSCGLTFPLDTSRNRKKQIDRIQLKAKIIEANKEEKKMLEFSKYHRYIKADEFKGFEKAILGTEPKQKLPDSDYAVVIRVKDKATGKIQKICKYPINDEANITASLIQISTPEEQEVLKTLRVSLTSALKKIYARAKKFGIKSEENTAKEKLTEAVEKVTIELNTTHQKELTKKDADLKKAEADLKAKDAELKAVEEKKLVKARREELGDDVKDVKDEDLVKKETYELYKAKKEEKEKAIEENTAEDDAGGLVTKKSKDFYSNFREGVDKKAFGKNKK